MVNPSEWDTTISIGFLEKGIENLPFFGKKLLTLYYQKKMLIIKCTRNIKI